MSTAKYEIVRSTEKLGSYQGTLLINDACKSAWEEPAQQGRTFLTGALLAQTFIS